jgi:lysophospholipase L1-like esterase
MDKQEGSGRAELWKNALLLLSSLCLAVVLAEVLTRLFVPVRDVGALFTVDDPVMGKRIKKRFHTVRVAPEFTMSFTTNSLGFRGPEPISPPADSILFLGDSFTMGFGVSDGEEYPALIKAKLDATLGKDAVGVINAGMGDSGNGRWIKLLKTEADQFKLRLVVLQVTDNDFEDNVREAYFRVSDSGALHELPLKTSKAKFLEPFLDAIPGLSNFYLYSLIRQSFYQSFVRPPAGAVTNEDVNYAVRLTERLIAEAVSICQKKGYPVFAILVGLEGDRLGQVQAVFQANQIPALLVPAKTKRPDLYYKIDGHWNPAGHAFVARALFDQLLWLNLLARSEQRNALEPQK